jgi:hypothetical protein
MVARNREQKIRDGKTEETYGQVFLYYDQSTGEFVVDAFYKKAGDVQLSRQRFLTLKEADEHVESVRDMAAVHLARKVLDL